MADVTELSIAGVMLISLRRFKDTRGSFCETYNPRMLGDAAPDFVQDNESWNSLSGTLRGLHFQKPPNAQAKLVRCVQGAILDVAVDLRSNSPTFGKHVAQEVSAENNCAMFIPVGFAHGFCTLRPDTLVQYKVSGLYSPEDEMGIAWNDPALGINWLVDDGKAVLSDKDCTWPSLAELPANLF